MLNMPEHRLVLEQIDAFDKEGYWKALKRNWGQADIVTIEHDMRFSESQLREMINCPESNCCALYRIKPKSAQGHDAKTFAQGFYERSDLRLLELSAADEAVGKMCTHPSFGFTKISRDAQRRVSLNEPLEWRDMDYWIFSRMRVPFHIHSEIRHNH